MIKFFRKIRQDLLKENKTKKYFKYAVGEIILVVIGILIALQINNWNENRKSNAILKNYYSQIVEDLKQDYNLINSRISSLETNIKIYEDFKEDFQNQTSLKAAVIRTTKLDAPFGYLEFNSNTIKTLSTTGDIKRIPEYIRNKLITLIYIQDNVSNTAQINNEMFLKEMMNASRLGYNQTNRFIEKENFDDSYPLLNALKIEDNYREIALIVKAAFKFKNVNEVVQLNTLKGGKAYIHNLYNIINKELDGLYKSIESITYDNNSLMFLYTEGKSVDKIIAFIKQQDRESTVYNISENEINLLGYHIMNSIKQPKEALKVFRFNTEFYPDAFNTHDSYGECLLRMGDKENAIKAYKKSLELNTDNQNAIEVLSELKLEQQ
ncbi:MULTISPECIES: tetratricopeptide repeat protein [unclassified Polaribacter]|uniref:tetratricopeptide repeat protein n=1 Tax=unclassified Polaribacter TaxID=196858 RepID=UPI0011BDAACB|nr:MULTISPECIES: DUF6090 family protein [unclassified Polaribacter]TXD52648.1 hypothetical protein ES043_07350 [Polaribacter sp. IC063]TXD60617.1 hypothetical protein ES044_06885 [Polaribacter sp. IC066]